MAFVAEEADGELTDNLQHRRTIENLLQNIRIPAEFAHYDAIDDHSKLEALSAWRKQALDCLLSLQDVVERSGVLPRDDTAKIVCAVGPFLCESAWSSGKHYLIAQEILDNFDVDTSLLEAVLSSGIKPVFQASDHPMLSKSTGRALSRPLGGPMAAHDMYEGQIWKSHPGIESSLLWCLRHIPTNAYDRMWYLVVPPIMTLLDDYEMYYKISAISAVRTLLGTAPPGLLRRTGVADLLFASLKRALTLLHSPDTPTLIRAAGTAAVELTTTVWPEGSRERFAHLCELLGDAIIGSIWVYAYQEQDAVAASTDVVLPLVSALGIGAVRFLKALIPQLTYPLHLSPDRAPQLSLQIASLHALQAVVRVCTPRIHRWKSTVLEGVAKCWVTLSDSGRDDQAAVQLRGALQAVCAQLKEAVPPIREDYDYLLRLDENVFAPLLGRRVSTSAPLEPADT